MAEPPGPDPSAQAIDELDAIADGQCVAEDGPKGVNGHYLQVRTSTGDTPDPQFDGNVDLLTSTKE